MCGPLTSFVVVFLSDLLVHVKHGIFVLVLNCFNSTIFTNNHIYGFSFKVGFFFFFFLYRVCKVWLNTACLNVNVHHYKLKNPSP